MEDPRYLSEQLITYIGNKRALLPLIGRGLEFAVERLEGSRDGRVILDLFSGSGVVSRFFKRFADRLIVNDLEGYAEVLSRCYLANLDGKQRRELEAVHADLLLSLHDGTLQPGLIAKDYAPRDQDDIQAGERAFYTPQNAAYLDTARRLVGELPAELRPFFLGPLLTEASIHANTAGVFKGFYKDRHTGLGRFGGTGQDALTRITQPIRLPFPIFSRFNRDFEVHRRDANELVRRLPPVDIAYIDPPYNQHPYGSNYFMLNLLVDYQEPREVSPVSGIPVTWNRSAYNKRAHAWPAMRDLVDQIDARVLMISMNSESLIDINELIAHLNTRGETQVFSSDYATFRGSRNLRGRSLTVTEFLLVTLTQ